MRGIIVAEGHKVRGETCLQVTHIWVGNEPPTDQRTRDNQGRCRLGCALRSPGCWLPGV